MNDDEIRIAIAEVLGWVWYRLPEMRGERRRYRSLFLPAVHEIDQTPEWLVRADGTERICNFEYMWHEGMVPDYTKSLDAMHEAEQLFEDKPIDTKSMYWDHLALIAMPEPFPGDDTFLRDYVMLRATAKQRAEAFLRTLGKWKET